MDRHHLLKPSALPLPASPALILAGILAVAAALRVTLLGESSLSYDEIFVVGVTRLRWTEILPMLKAGDFHPPLYYVLMKAWVSLAGTGELALRIPSACFSVLSVGLTYALVRRIAPEPVSLLSAFLMSVSPFHIMAAQEARMYALLGVLALASTVALSASVARGGALRWAGYAVLATLTAYTQYIGFLVLLAHGIWVASYERGHLAAWLGAMAAAAILYAPWVPSLWTQAVHMRGILSGLGGAVTARDPGDLLGLFAFGGSLFGMASYLFPGTLPPVEQMVVLLPFLVILWLGAPSLASNRRSLAFLGLPPVVTLGVTFTMALANHYYYPSRLAFLEPFYAAFLAHGIIAVAERVRGWRAWAQVMVTASLLAYSAPVLDRYYREPGFDHFQWRSAASLVEKQARPGDLFLYVNTATRTAFTYYFHDQHHSLTLAASNTIIGQASSPWFTDDAARQLAARYPRMWLIVSIPFTKTMQAQLFPPLASAFRVVGARQFTGTGVYLLEAKPL
jgi:hypothetical protein